MKKLFIIGSAVSAFLLVGLVPLNMFVIKFPEWVIWIPAAMLAAMLEVLREFDGDFDEEIISTDKSEENEDFEEMKS